MVILLYLNESISVAQSSFAPNAFIMLSSITMAAGPKSRSTRAFNARDLFPRWSTKRIYPKLLRCDPLALYNNIEPCEIGNTRACRKVA